MPNSTSNFGLLQPLVANPTDQDLWGSYLNTDIADLDTLLLSALTWAISPQTSSFSVVGRTDGTITLGSSKTFFTCNATSAAITGSLPAASSVDDGFTVAFKKTDSSANTVTIAAAGSDTIDGAASLVVSAQYDSFVLVCDGDSAWEVQSYKHGTAPKALSLNIQEFTAPGSINYTPSAGIVGAKVKMAAGGGGSGGCAGNQGAPGAGGGAYQEFYLSLAQITAALVGGAIPGTVGAAGTAGASGSNAGGNGGTTSLTGVGSCTGGVGGPAGAGQDTFAAGSVGGTFSLSVGQPIVQANGGQGSYGGQNSQSHGGLGGGNPVAQGGPATLMVAGGSSAVSASSGTGYGAAAGGGCSQSGSGNVSGAAGIQGFISIEEIIYA